MIYFIGAGPGDSDLITVKGRKLLEQADVVIYTGSLVWDAHFQFCKPDCKFHNSAEMTLEAIMEGMIAAEKQGKTVVRLHTGDPTIYGAIGEQMAWLAGEGIACEVVPGVSSFTAGCAALQREFTVPNVTQTIILTRIEGRTPVPESEALEMLAAHRCAMAIFLSVKQIDAVIEKLKQGYGRDDVPAAVVYKATWPDQRVIVGTLQDIAEKVKAAGIQKFSQILVGDFLKSENERSRLYDPGFSHEFRKRIEH
ncbi:MAG: precorrin-4 C(11)-methyltransferase [Candidatus Vecturithrix sp.]|nr:precorrin-4 C(11)-methyltransferase [Candidatus Vecturithrix sp.]